MESFNNTQVAFARMTNYGLRRAYILFKSLNMPVLFSLVKLMVNTFFKLHIPVGWIVKPTVFKQFIGGTTINECLPITLQLQKYKVKSILDYSSENGADTGSIERALTETLNSIEVASKNPHIAFAVFKPTAFCSKTTLEKIGERNNIPNEIEPKIEKFKQYVDTLCKKGFELGVPVMIDAEDFSFQGFIDDVAEDMMEKYNTNRAIVFNTLQMYRNDRLNYLEIIYNKAVERNYYLGLKLVRGAYMERERLRAKQLGYNSPIWPDKNSTDTAFDKALEFCTGNISRISLFSGTHNEKSNLYLIELMKKYGIAPNDSRVYFSQLYGMSDNITFNLAREGYNVAKYIPYGPVRKVLPYLIRRAEENSAVAGQTCRELNLIKSELQRRRM